MAKGSPPSALRPDERGSELIKLELLLMVITAQVAVFTIYVALATYGFIIGIRSL